MFERFDIYITGRLVDGTDPAEARRALCRMDGIDEARALRLLSGVPIKVKSGVDVETAGKYRATFRKIGILIDIRPSEAASGVPVEAAVSRPDSEPATASSEAAPNPDRSAAAGHAELELLPPNTGSFEDCALPVVPEPLPDISALTLDLSDGDLDPSPPPPAPAIDTDHLSAEPANAGTLEDCTVEKPAMPIPDVSHLRLLD